jgi:hypothetical protein
MGLEIEEKVIALFIGVYRHIRWKLKKKEWGVNI